VLTDEINQKTTGETNLFIYGFLGTWVGVDFMGIKDFCDNELQEFILTKPSLTLELDLGHSLQQYRTQS
jgi:hypothetical protein